VVEKQGQPFVAVVSLNDFDILERLRRDNALTEFNRLASLASADETDAAESIEDDIVAAVRHTRQALYNERYGRG
jgi:hypothetical protein